MIMTITLPTVAIAAFLMYLVIKRQMHYWLPGYLFQICLPKEKPKPGEPVHVFFCLVDHFDLGYGRVSLEEETDRINTWLKEYPKIALRHKDSDGVFAQHTWFFPPHYNRSGHLEKLIKLCQMGFGEIEFHLHHDQIPPYKDTSQTLKEKIERCLENYSRYGIFQPQDGGKKRYGFIHGDWALDNSRHKGEFCGINDEISILKETGCYADFTFPSSCESQPRKINSIYYATDDPKKPKSYDSGIDVRVGGKEAGDLMIIEGPLGIRWDNRKFRILPRIENGAIEGFAPPTKPRIDYWIKAGIHVKGRPEWIVVKVYTHGPCKETSEMFLGNAADEMFSYLEERYSDKKKFFLHYVTARQLYNIIKAAEAGKEGNPGEYRDFFIPAYDYGGKIQ